MVDYDEQLTEKVEDLIRTGREDDWWDFKQCHYEDRASLLHDIICLANNRANRDAYLILGIQDQTLETVGVENDPYRKNQQNIVDFLRLPNFAGQTRPRVEVRTIYLEHHEVDVLVIKNSADVPYYLIEDYSDKNYAPEGKKKGKTVRAFHIYTRVMDNNTPIDQSADIRDVELLWKKRFGLLQTPLEQINVLLQNPDEWAEEDERYYHKQFPQYTISIEAEQDENGICNERYPEFYHYLQTDHRAYYGTLKIYHYTTQLYSCQTTDIDGHRMTVPCPVWEYIKYGRPVDSDICMCFYTRDSLKYLLLCFLENKIGSNNGGEAQIATRKHLETILLFEDDDAKDDFLIKLVRRFDEFDALFAEQREPYIESDSSKVKEIESKRIRDGRVLKLLQQNIS